VTGTTSVNAAVTRPSGEKSVAVRPPQDRRETGDACRLLLTGAEIRGRLALVETRERRGEGPPRHRHHWEDEVVYVLAGEVCFDLDGARLVRPAGTCAVLPAGREHAYAVTSAEARLLVLAAPAGLEGLYRELSGFTAPSGTDVERLVAVAARYGVEITGPSLDNPWRNRTG
jgi:quercetin dioxygenase-like cupin family protein